VKDDGGRALGKPVPRPLRLGGFFFTSSSLFLGKP
jgi:hypothetical protein